MAYTTANVSIAAFLHLLTIEPDEVQMKENEKREFVYDGPVQQYVAAYNNYATVPARLFAEARETMKHMKPGIYRPVAMLPGEINTDFGKTLAAAIKQRGTRTRMGL
jgi:hypothetical protein